jgi:pimeloyl-ACP methyl ester carboxylesterase
MRARLGRGLLGLAAASALVAGAALPAAAAPLPVEYNWVTGYVGNMPTASQAPAGAITTDSRGNLASCSSPGKLPVILVHGTWENQKTNWSAAAPLLKNAGFCVYSFTYGGNPGDVFAGWKSIADSAGTFGAFANKVLATTGAPQVDIVGHSQGGMMPRYWVKFGDSWTGGSFGKGTSKIRKLVALAPSNHGTTLSGITELGRTLGIDPLAIPLQPAAIDQQIGSAFTKKMDTCPNGLPNADICAGDTITYTVLETNGDQIVTPYTNAFLKANPAAPAAKVTNVKLQDKCILDASEHLAITYDSFAYGLVLQALGVDPSKVPGASPSCKLITPYVGG